MMSALKSKQIDRYTHTHTHTTNMLVFSGRFVIAQNPGDLDIAHSFTIVPQVAASVRVSATCSADVVATSG